MSTVSAVDFGLSTGGTHAENAAAITSASQSLTNGGTVTAPAGTFNVLGALLNTGVTLSLDVGTVLVGDGTSGTAMIQNRPFGVLGSVTAGGVRVTVPDGTIFRVGATVGIKGAGAIQDTVALRHYSTIVDTGPTWIDIEHPAITTTASRAVNSGAMRCVVTGGTLDGAKTVADGPNGFPVRWLWGASCDVIGVTIRNSDHGAVMLERGCRWCLVARNVLNNNGRLTPDQLGSSVWIFQGGRENVIEMNTIDGPWNGVKIDDRTVDISEHNGNCLDNIVRHNTIANANFAVVFEGVSDNYATRNTISLGQIGVISNDSNQGVTTLDSDRNFIAKNLISSMTTGIRVDGDTNTVTGNIFTSCTEDFVERAR